MQRAFETFAHNSLSIRKRNIKQLWKFNL